MTDAINGLNKAQKECMVGLALRAEFLERRLTEIETQMDQSEETEMYMIDIYNALLRSYTGCVTAIFNAIPKDGA